MSLVRFACRQAVVRALRGKTLCGEEIKDSHNPPADFLKDDAAPFAAVYTDAQGRNLRDLDPTRARDSLTVTIEIVVAAKLAGVKAKGWVIAGTDHGVELTIDVIERQIMAALADETDPWASIYRTIIRDNPTVRSERGAEANGALRRAGRQIVIEGSPLPEPAFGQAPTGVWERFLSLCEADPVLADRVPLLKSLFLCDAIANEWSSVQRSQLLAAGEGQALLVSPREGALPGFGGATPS